ncbi:MAG: DinB family protein [Terriglobales bacterium]
MDLLSYLERLFEYDDWANREVVAALRALPYAPHKAVRLMAHVVAVEYVWLARLKHQPDPAVWPEWNLEEVAHHREALPAIIADYFKGILPDALGNEITYTNTKGETWKNSIADVLTQITIHSAYHRGQIAMVLRDTGVTPPYTDYIQAVRTRQIEE